MWQLCLLGQLFIIFISTTENPLTSNLEVTTFFNGCQITLKIQNPPCWLNIYLISNIFSSFFRSPSVFHIISYSNTVEYWLTTKTIMRFCVRTLKNKVQSKWRFFRDPPATVVDEMPLSIFTASIDGPLPHKRRANVGTEHRLNSLIRSCSDK